MCDVIAFCDVSVGVCFDGTPRNVARQTTSVGTRQRGVDNRGSGTSGLAAGGRPC